MKKRNQGIYYWIVAGLYLNLGTMHAASIENKTSNLVTVSFTYGNGRYDLMVNVGERKEMFLPKSMKPANPPIGVLYTVTVLTYSSVPLMPIVETTSVEIKTADDVNKSKFIIDRSKDDPYQLQIKVTPLLPGEFGYTPTVL